MLLRAPPLFAVLALLAAPAFAQDNSEDAPPAVDEQAAAEDGSETAAAEPLPLPALAPAMQPMVVASPFSPDQRNGWLAQCRNTFRQAGAALGGGNGQLDACETQLLDFERTYVPPAGGQSAPPVIMVRVPIVRQPVAEASIVEAPVAGDEE